MLARKQARCKCCAHTVLSMLNRRPLTPICSLGAQYVATVLAVGTECDIACLTVKDDDFWDGTEEVSFGELPHLQDSILVIGCAARHTAGRSRCYAIFYCLHRLIASLNIQIPLRAQFSCWRKDSMQHMRSYPIGGDSQSVTSGVVSRIEVTAYVHGSSELLGMQIDAAINSGNSGGPAFNGAGECVGIAFQVRHLLQLSQVSAGVGALAVIPAHASTYS